MMSDYSLTQNGMRILNGIKIAFKTLTLDVEELEKKN
ncbi:hypothetical protein NSIN_20555 [Nitrosotalea sinensis]|jgi:hypothetical protein|uniref:Uncharacterized protein n=1 Tax=Nitrosotalea sinensis TaxID=1499975 RepID=A0A2H1EG85_9ARCH|nr:hypothetical protein NSIN_20555 [Candidatus Nitrosotalea sinensis]